MKIEITQLGRYKWSGLIEMPDTNDFSAIDRAVEKVAEKRLASRFPEAEYDPIRNEGVIFAGARTVGYFRVIRAEAK